MNTIAEKFVQTAKTESQEPIVTEDTISIGNVSLKILPDLEATEPHYFELQFDTKPMASVYPIILFESLPSLGKQFIAFANNAQEHLQGDGYTQEFGDWVAHVKQESRVNYLTLSKRGA